MKKVILLNLSIFLIIGLINAQDTNFDTSGDPDGFSCPHFAAEPAEDSGFVDNGNECALEEGGFVELHYQFTVSHIDPDNPPVFYVGVIQDIGLIQIGERPPIVGLAGPMNDFIELEDDHGRLCCQYFASFGSIQLYVDDYCRLDRNDPKTINIPLDNYFLQVLVPNEDGAGLNPIDAEFGPVHWPKSCYEDQPQVDGMNSPVFSFCIDCNNNDSVIRNPYSYNNQGSTFRTSSESSGSEINLISNKIFSDLTVYFPLEGKYQIRIGSIGSQIVLNQRLDFKFTKENYQDIDISNLPAGLYFLNVLKNGRDQKTMKFVKVQ